MNKKIGDYFNRQKSPQKEICQQLHKIIFEAFPNIEEEMKWGVPAFAGGKFYIVALKDHVNLGFSIKNLTKEELTLFDGGGKTTMHIEIESIEKIDKNRIVELLKLVEMRAKE